MDCLQDLFVVPQAGTCHHIWGDCGGVLNRGRSSREWECDSLSQLLEPAQCPKRCVTNRKSLVSILPPVCRVLSIPLQPERKGFTEYQNIYNRDWSTTPRRKFMGAISKCLQSTCKQTLSSELYYSPRLLHSHLYQYSLLVALPSPERLNRILYLVLFN